MRGEREREVPTPTLDKNVFPTYFYESGDMQANFQVSDLIHSDM